MKNTQSTQTIMDEITDLDISTSYGELCVSGATYRQYVDLCYSHFSSDHGIEHARQVYSNARIIADLLPFTLSKNEERIFEWVMLMHDALDYKLVKMNLCRPEEEIYAVTAKLFGTGLANIIKHIHENCSWSKRKTSKPVPPNEFGITDNIRLILQDADWIEAHSIQRCLDYGKSVFPHFTEDQNRVRVVKHIHDKLLSIRDGLNFEESKKLVDERQLQQPLRDFLTQYEHLVALHPEAYF